MVILPLGSFRIEDGTRQSKGKIGNSGPNEYEELISRVTLLNVIDYPGISFETMSDLSTDTPPSLYRASISCISRGLGRVTEGIISFLETPCCSVPLPNGSPSR